MTSATPKYGAWGDRLRPGIKAIAVSRDLLRLGLTRGARVQISGLPGTYRVLDKMASRWHRRIDIYMGRNVKAALRWGKQRVRIWWIPPKKDHTTTRPHGLQGGSDGTTAERKAGRAERFTPTNQQ